MADIISFIVTECRYLVKYLYCDWICKEYTKHYRWRILSRCKADKCIVFSLYFCHCDTYMTLLVSFILQIKLKCDLQIYSFSVLMEDLIHGKTQFVVIQTYRNNYSTSNLNFDNSILFYLANFLLYSILFCIFYSVFYSILLYNFLLCSILYSIL